MINALEQLGKDRLDEVAPIYAIFGDDAYLRHEATRLIVRSVLGGDDDEAMGLSRFSGPQAELSAVLDELRTLPFLAPRRVVVIDEADKFVTEHRKALERYAEQPSESGVLVLLVKTWPSNTKLAKLVNEVGQAIECKAPRESELPGWLVQLARQRWGQSLKTDAARLLVELVGPEPGLLASEVDKLAVAVGEGQTIDRDAVARMVGGGRVLAVWDMIDRATTGDGPGALAVLDRLLAAGEVPQVLLAAMGASLRKVYYAGRLRMARRDLNDACRQAGVPGFAYKTVQRQHAHLGPSRVDHLPDRLLRADLDLKDSRGLDRRTVLERLLIELAQPRRD